MSGRLWALFAITIILGVSTFLMELINVQQPFDKNSMTSTTTTTTKTTTTTTTGTPTRSALDIQIEQQIRLRDYCHNRSDIVKSRSAGSLKLYYSDTVRTVYCEIPKSAFTGWKRMMAAFDGTIYHPAVKMHKEDVPSLKFNAMNMITPGEHVLRAFMLACLF